MFLVYSVLALLPDTKDVDANRTWKWLRHHGGGILLVVLCTIFLHAHEPAEFRVLYDEPAHLVVSEMMHLDKMAMNANRSHYIGDHFVILNATPPFRQYFFSFVLYLRHSLVGYSPSAPFVVNGIVGIGLLITAYSIGTLVANRIAGCISVLLITAVPLVAQNILSGGYDIFNLFLVSTLFVAAIKFMACPSEAAVRLLNCLVACAWAASQVRYESILYFVGVIGLILVRWLYRRDWIVTWSLCLAPIALAPSFASNLIVATDNSVLQSPINDHGGGPLQLNYFLGNVQDLLVYLYSYDEKGSSSLFAAVVGTVGCIGIAAHLVSRRLLGNENQRNLVVLLLCFFAVSIVYTPVLLHNWSSALDPLAARFTLPIWFCFALGGGWLIGERLAEWPRLQYVLLAATSCCILIGAATASGNHRDTSLLVPSRAERWFLDFANRQEKPISLFVSKSPLELIAHKCAAVTLQSVNDDPVKCVGILQSGIYKYIYILERLEYPQSESPSQNKDMSTLNDHIIVEEIASRSFAPGQLARIVKLVGYKTTDGKVMTTSSAPPLTRVFKNDAERSDYLFSLYP